MKRGDSPLAGIARKCRCEVTGPIIQLFYRPAIASFRYTPVQLTNHMHLSAYNSHRFNQKQDLRGPAEFTSRWQNLPNCRERGSTLLQKLRSALCGESLDELEAKLSSFALEGADLPVSMLLFVEPSSFIDELHAVAEHTVHQAAPARPPWP